ncbi:hypothetical protein niasHT_012048 [Heterodera trifolii]|uniref:Reverse transcriptase/retrotransposon-derived protein RNase H-like domain-containing protein n=1 Tax=Heterodera trifolii TaxID=157864 RepID=A0ABD2KTL4_9BILA
MVSELLLTHYDHTLPIVVASDASKDGIGATICHIFPNKKEKVIEHASTCSRTTAKLRKKLWRLVRGPRTEIYTAHGPQAIAGHLRLQERHPHLCRQPTPKMMFSHA